MPEQFPLRGIAYGQRWVSTPACRAVRAAASARLDPIHYMTLYLMTEPVDETLREFRQLGQELHDAGRFHLHRHAHLAGPFAFVSSVVAPRVLISAEAVPYRPHRGVYVVVREATAAGLDLNVVCATDGVVGVWDFADDERRITVAWLDGEPLQVAAALGPPVDGVEFAGPLETITPYQWDWFER